MALELNENWQILEQCYSNLLLMKASRAHSNPAKRARYCHCSTKENEPRSCWVRSPDVRQNTTMRTLVESFDHIAYICCV